MTTSSIGSRGPFPISHQHHHHHHHQQPQQQGQLANEQLWLRVGKLAMTFEDWDRAVIAFETALKHNPLSPSSCYLLASCLHQQQQFVQASEVYQRLITLLSGPNAQSATGNAAALQEMKGEAWASLGHCALMLDDLGKAYSSFQQSLQFSGTPQNGMIWFFIGLLYDRYAADDLACEAFLTALKYEQQASPKDEGQAPSSRQREIYYRLGMVFGHKKKWDLAKDCLRYSAEYPPAPLGKGDVLYQYGLLFGLSGNYEEAQRIFQEILQKESKGTSPLVLLKIRMILVWIDARAKIKTPEDDESTVINLHGTFIPGRPDVDLDEFIQALKGLVDENPGEPLGWYIVARIHCLQGNPTLAYEAYQQAVYRDGSNAGFWNSIGILYYDIQQYRDALDAFSRAIHLAPLAGETWWNLGVLYEACNGRQLGDALDAYTRALELGYEPEMVKARMDYLKGAITAVSAGTEVADDPSPPRLVEYCPIPFEPRQVILGNYPIPPQRPALLPTAPPPATAKYTPGSGRPSINIPPQMSQGKPSSLNHLVPLTNSSAGNRILFPHTSSGTNPNGHHHILVQQQHQAQAQQQNLAHLIQHQQQQQQQQQQGLRLPIRPKQL